MVVISKRFGMDDVPICMKKTWCDARKFCEGKVSKYATKEDQRIAQVDIGTEFISFLLVSFNKYGCALRSEVYCLGDKR